MNIKAEFIVGKNSGNDWSGFYGYIPEDTSDSKTELFCVARLKSDAEDIELERMAGLLLDEFQDAYYNDFSSEEDEIVKLEDSFQKMKIKLEVIVSREDSILEKGLDIEMTIALVNGGILTVGIIGESKILIYRNGKLVDISKGLVDANMLGFVKTGSLNLDPKDRIVLSTSVPFNSFYNNLLDSSLFLNINELNTIKDEKGSAILLFADKTLDWNSRPEVILTPDLETEDDKMVSVEEILMDAENEVEGIVEPENMDNADFADEKPDIPQIEPMPNYNSEEVEYIQEEEDDIDQDADIPPAAGFAANLNMARERARGLFGKLSRSGNVTPRASDVTPEFDDEETDSEIEPPTLSNKSSQLFNQVKNRALALKGKFSKSSLERHENYSNDKTYQQLIKRIINAIKSSIAWLTKTIKIDVLGIGVDRLDRRRNPSKLKRNRLILGGLLIVFVLLIYIGWRDADSRRIEVERVQVASNKISQLETDINQAVGQVETVKTQEQNKKDILKTKLTTLSSSIETQKKQDLFIDELSVLTNKIKNAKDSLEYIKEINDTSLQVITDVGKLFSDSNLSDLVFSNGSLYISDAKRNVVYKVATNVNSDAQELVKNLNTPAHLVRNAAGDIVLYDSDAGSAMGVIRVQSGQFSRLAGLSPALIGTVSEVALYGNNDALYELHQNHQQIFKRDKLGNSYGGGGAVYVTINPPNWRTDPEFAKAIDISVPYEIYVLIEGQGLKRYLAGGNNTLNFNIYQNFAQSDFDLIKQATAFDIGTKYLAVADPKGKRVMVFEVIDNEQKNLKFIQQFVYRGSNNIFSNIKEISLDEETNNIYVLDGSEIIKLSL